MNSKNSEIVQSFYGSLAQGNFPALIALLDPEFRAEKPASLPYGGVYKGASGVGELAQALAKYYDLRQTRMVPEVFAADGDHVFVYVRSLLWAHGATEVFETVAVDVWTVRDGKLLTMKTFYEDTAESLRRLHSAAAQRA